MPDKQPLKFYVDILQQKNLLEQLVMPECTSTPSNTGTMAHAQTTLEKLVENLTYDSRQVTPGSLFICKGNNFRGEYLHSAEQAGAFAYVAEKIYPEVPLPALITSNIRYATVVLGQSFFHHVTDEFTTIGITGTKGKSTTAYFLRNILDAQSRAENTAPTALLSSISTFDGNAEVESHLTTPEPLELYKHFQNAYDNGINRLVMEVSSQALKYGRVRDLEFSIACFLNIGSDHISEIEHPNFADYFASKLKIFSSCQRACINSGADHLTEIRAAAAEAGISPVSFGYKNDDAVQISEIHSQADGFQFHISGRFYNEDFAIAMPGVFNVENAAAAITMAGMLGIPAQYVQEGLRNTTVSGRMQIYKSADKNVVAIVDFAHNKMSFDAVFDCAEKEYPGYAPVAVFGSAGGKAYSRRRDLGETAGRRASYVILTEDDPDKESVADICADISRYVECPQETISSRAEAIKRAILGEYGNQPAPQRRIILLLGKGAEDMMKRADGWEKIISDAELAQRYLAEI